MFNDGKLCLMSGRRLVRKLPEWSRGLRVPPNQAILVSGQPACQGAGVSVPEYYLREHCGISFLIEPQWGSLNTEAPPGCEASVANFLVYKGECGAVARRSQWGRTASMVLRFQRGQDGEKQLLTGTFGFAQDTTPMARPTTAWTLALVSRLRTSKWMVGR